MNLEQALATGKPFETIHTLNLERGWVELFIDPQYSAYHLELVDDIAKDPFVLDTKSLPILKYHTCSRGGYVLLHSMSAEKLSI